MSVFPAAPVNASFRRPRPAARARATADAAPRSCARNALTASAKFAAATRTRPAVTKVTVVLKTIPAAVVAVATRQNAVWAMNANLYVQVVHTQQNFAVAIRNKEAAGPNVLFRKNIIPVSVVGIALIPIN